MRNAAEDWGNPRAGGRACAAAAAAGALSLSRRPRLSACSRSFDLFVAKGYLWVEFFFALSGFMLMHVYGSRVEEFFRGGAYTEFLKARLARLYPLHLATLLHHAGDDGHLRRAGGGGRICVDLRCARLSSLRDMAEPSSPICFWCRRGTCFRNLSWNGVSWFVSVEFFLCLIFPLYLWAARGGA